MGEQQEELKRTRVEFKDSRLFYEHKRFIFSQILSTNEIIPPPFTHSTLLIIIDQRVEIEVHVKTNSSLRLQVLVFTLFLSLFFFGWM